MNLEIDRESLVNQAILLLTQNECVGNAVLYGSLANGRADQYSDIDLHIHLQGISDREFFEMVPDILQPIGRYIINDWGPTALPDRYVRVLNFADYPLFWHLDILCDSEIHVDGSDLITTFNWLFLFRVWIDELKKVLRGKKNTNVMDRFVKEYIDINNLPVSLKKRITSYLDLIYKYIKSIHAPCDELYYQCDVLLQEYLRTGTVKIDC